MEAEGSDRAGQGVPDPVGAGREGVLRGGRRRGERTWHQGPAVLPGDAGPAAGGDVREHLRRAERADRHRARAVLRLPRILRRRGGRPMTTLTLSRALHEGLRKAMEADPKVLIMGEDVGKLGGVFRVTDGLQKDFGEARVVDTPLAESAIVGTAIGLALRGYRPVCEIQFDGFVYPATDQIVSQLAKMRSRSRGHVALPVVIRIPFGGGIGAVEHHSESPEIFFAHTAGLRVVACADPADAFAMVQLAIAGEDPVIFFEPKRRYWDKAEVDLAAPLSAALPLDKARVVQPGDDVTLLSYGPLVRTCLEAPVLRVGGFAIPYPSARVEEYYLPDLDRILDAVDRTFAY